MHFHCGCEHSHPFMRRHHLRFMDIPDIMTVEEEIRELEELRELLEARIEKINRRLDVLKGKKEKS